MAVNSGLVASPGPTAKGRENVRAGSGGALSAGPRWDESKRQTMHVEVLIEMSRDAGSIPAASTFDLVLGRNQK